MTVQVIFGAVAESSQTENCCVWDRVALWKLSRSKLQAEKLLWQEKLTGAEA